MTAGFDFDSSRSVAMALAQVSPLVASLHVPEAYVREWLSASVVASSTLHSLAGLGYVDRQRVIKKTMELNTTGQLRVGVDHYIMGCVRNRMSPRADPYGPGIAIKDRRCSVSGADVRTAPGSSIGPIASLESVDTSGAGQRESSGFTAPPTIVCPTMPYSAHGGCAPRARPPAWVAELTRGEVIRCSIVRAVSERCSDHVRLRLCAIDPFMQFAVCAGVIMDASKWENPTAVVFDFCDKYDIVQAVISEPVPAALPSVPRCARVAIFAVGVGLGAAAPALLAAAGKVKLADPSSPVPVEIVEVNAACGGRISDGFDVVVIPRVTFPVLMYSRVQDHVDMVRRRCEYWVNHPERAVNAALMVGVDAPSGYHEGLMLEAAVMLQEAGVLAALVAFKRGGDDGGLDMSDRFGSAVLTDASRYGSPARPWTTYRSCLAGGQLRGPASRDLAVPLSAASQSRARVQPASAPQYRPGEYLPSFEAHRALSARMLLREMLSARDQMHVRLLWGGYPVEGRRLLTREALMRIHGFEQWPQAAAAHDACKREGIINPVSGVGCPAGAAGSVACGAQRYCIPCEPFYDACDRSVHAGVLVAGLALPLMRLTYRPTDRGSSGHE